MGIGIIKNEPISYSDIEEMSQKGSFLYGMDGKKWEQKSLKDYLPYHVNYNGYVAFSKKI